jgi:hypothetical protein
MLEDKTQMFNSTQKMFDTLEGDFIAIGGLLHEIKQKKQFRMRGYESFKDYVELELNTAPTFANKLLRVYDMFVVNLQMSEIDMKEVGFEKFSMVYPIFNKNSKYKDQQFLDEWMKYLEMKTISELKVLIKEFKESQKQLDIKKETIKSGWERGVTFSNSNKQELLFQIAVMFLLTKDDDLIKFNKTLKDLKRSFEQQLVDDDDEDGEPDNTPEKDE